MNSQGPKLVVGFIIYGRVTAKYLPYFLDSLKKQTFSDFQILVCDNTPKDVDNPNLEYLKKDWLVTSGENRGFSGAYNILIQEALKRGAEYFLALNPDIILEPEAILNLVKKMKENKTLGSASPKVLKWDFENNKKMSIIDTCGIRQRSGLIFYDLGQGETDNGQYDDQEILGPSGAAAIFRSSALKKIKESERYFDEMMFMYKEDCDLAYRLYLSGLKSVCVGGAIVYHDRTASGKGGGNLGIALNRKNKSRQVKAWSFLNQQIIFYKYWRLQGFFDKLNIVWYQIKTFIFITLFEQYLFKEWLKFLKIRKNIKKY